MKERALDIAKWALIFMMAGAVFYLVCPKYEIAGQGSCEVQHYNGESKPQ